MDTLPAGSGVVAIAANKAELRSPDRRSSASRIKPFETDGDQKVSKSKSKDNSATTTTETPVAPTAINSPIEESFAGVRSALFSEINGLRNGTTKPDRANAVARCSAEILRSNMIQIEVLRFLNGMPTPAWRLEGDTGLLK